MARRLAAAAFAVVSLAGCTGVPARSGVHVVRKVSAEGPELPETRIRRRATSPRENAPPDEIVRGFLSAHGDTRNDRAIARTYLAPQVSWNDDAGVTVVAATPRTGRAAARGDAATVPVTLARIGTISPRGEFRAASAPARAVTFRLTRVPSLGWRIAEAPPGVVLVRDELAASYDRVTLYFPNQARRLVPQPMFLAASGQNAGTVVRALLAGPAPWLAPAVRTAIPNGTELIDPPSLVDGVVTLNFSRELRRASQEALAVVVAQLVWTLTEQEQVVAVRVLVEGETLAVPGHNGAREHRRRDFGDYAPVPATGDPRLYFVRAGAPYALGPGGVARVATTPPVATLAVNRSGTTLAVVTRPAGGRQQLRLVDLTGADPDRTALASQRIGTPSWEPDGQSLWVVHSSGGPQPQVVLVRPRGAPLAVASPVPGLTALRVSPDGSRAALVADGRLWVARIERSAAGGRILADARVVAPSVTTVTAVAFDGAAQVVFTARERDRAVLYRVDVDGYDLVRQRDRLPRGTVTALGVSAALPAERVVSIGGRVWRRLPGDDWTALPGPGEAATYAG
ncbi:MAG TPA: LpqB family beta-propeller domain-containing protein [Mycobacteriales bacterium]|nr:LpqB family beta-propeller domain-containing protein [Mycobacteriales bacterium]